MSPSMCAKLYPLSLVSFRRAIEKTTSVVVDPLSSGDFITWEEKLVATRIDDFFFERRWREEGE